MLNCFPQLRGMAAFTLGLCIYSASLTGVYAQNSLSVEAGTWLPILPDYRAASIVQSGAFNPVQTNIFNDDQTALGPAFGLNGQLGLNSNNALVMDLDLAWVNDVGASTTIADPGPTQSVWLASLNGTNFLNSQNGGAGRFSLDSDLLHYSEFVGFRHYFNDRNLSVDVGFSHQAFEQDYLFDAVFTSGINGQYQEQLDTNFFGGEIRGHLCTKVHCQPVQLDLGIGFFGRDTNYDGTSVFRTSGGSVFDQGTLSLSEQDFAVTLQAGIRGEREICNILLRPLFGLKYISSMPTINHPQTVIPVEPASLGSEGALILNSMVEICL